MRMTYRRARWLALALTLTILLAVTALGVPPAAEAAQDERGEGVEFPFRDPDGTLRWVATADVVQAQRNASHPLRDGHTVFAYDFRSAGSRLADADGVIRGVLLVMPFEEPQAGRGGRFAANRRMARLDAARATFYPSLRLLRMADVRLRVSLGDAAGAEPRMPGGPSAPPPATLTTPLLYVAFDPSTLAGTAWHVPHEPGSTLGARLFTPATVALRVPEQHLFIRQARGLDLREGDPDGRIRFGGRVRGFIANADWLDLAATRRETRPDRRVLRDPAIDPETLPGLVVFHCEGACAIDLGERFRQPPQRVEMARGVVLRQGFEGRELLCDRLRLDLTNVPSPANRSPLRELVAEDKVVLDVANSLRARGERFVVRFDVGPDGTQRQHGRLDGVEVIRVHTYDRDPISPTSFADAVPLLRTRIDGFAEGRVEYHRTVWAEPTPEGVRGEERWTLQQFARLERWVALSDEVPTRDDGSGRPDFDAPGLDDLRADDSRDPARRDEPLPTGHHVRDGYRLVNAINGSGIRRLGNAEDDSGNEGDEARRLAASADRQGRIDVRFRLRDVEPGQLPAEARARDTISREPIREFDGATVDNPGVRPIVEIFEDGSFGVRFFASRLDIARSLDPRGQMETMTATFRAERPQVTWITPQDRFALWDVPAVPGAVFRYSLSGSDTLRFEQDRRLVDTIPTMRRIRAPGAVTMRKAPFQGVGSYDVRRMIEWDCRDLELDFDNRFGDGLELNGIRAAARADGPLRLKLGRDVLRTQRLEYSRRPTVAEYPRPRVSGDVAVPAAWYEDLHLDGPVMLDLRDPRSTTLLPLRDGHGRLLTPALQAIRAERRVWIRTLLLRERRAGPQPAQRHVELVGPFEMRAFGDDPDRLRADLAPRLLARLTGEYLDARLVAGDIPGQLDRVEQALAAGDIEFDYRSRGLWLAGQRIDYVDDPWRGGDEGSRLRLIGDPEFRVVPVGADAPQGQFSVSFPASADPVLRANRRIELLGSPWRVRVLPRARLTWRPDEPAAEALVLEANRIDARLRPTGPDGVLLPPNEASDDGGRDETVAALFTGARVTVSQLLGVGNVLLEMGSRQATGETFVWRQHDGMYGYLWGERAVVRDISESGLSFELQAQQPGDPDASTGAGTGTGTGLNADAAGDRWMPGEGDPAPAAPFGTTFRYRERDASRPERRDIIEATNPTGHMRLRLRLPEDIRRTAREFLPSPDAGERERQRMRERERELERERAEADEFERGEPSEDVPGFAE